MSIKAFHIFFIVCAVVISLIFAVWSLGKSSTSSENVYFIVGCASFATAAVLGCYGISFAKKTKIS